MFVSIIFSLILVEILNPIVIFFEKRGFSRKKPVIIISVVAVLLITGIVIFWIIPFLSKVPDLIRYDLPLYRENLDKHFDKTIKYLIKEFPFLSSMNVEERINEAVSVFPQKASEAAKGIMPQVAKILILTPLFTFFILKDGRKLKRWLISLIPNRYFEMALHLTHMVNEQWAQYIRGKVFETIALGTITSVLFMPTGLVYVVPLGFFVGIAGNIPYVGPIIGALPVMVAAFMLDLSPKVIIYIAIVIFVIGRIIDRLVLLPLFVTRYANLHSVAIIVSLIVGERLMGLMGIIIAIPIVSMLNILIQEIYAFYKFRGRSHEAENSE